MKITITLKDPDGVYEAIRDEVGSRILSNSIAKDATPAALLKIRGIFQTDVEEKLAKWIDCGEYVTIEFDTDAGTAVVKER